MNGILQNCLEAGNNKAFWKYVKSQKQETFDISALKINGNVITDSISKAEIVNSQFFYSPFWKYMSPVAGFSLPQN